MNYFPKQLKRREFVKILSLMTAVWLFCARNVQAKRDINITKTNPNIGDYAKVVRIFDGNATDWDYKSPPYIDYVNYNVVKEMLKKGLMDLTSTKDTNNAWKKIISPYKMGDKIGIKPNFNNTKIGYSQAIMTSPQLLTAIVETLIESGFPAGDITIYDLTAQETGEINTWLNRHPINTVYRKDYDNILDKIVARLHLRQQDSNTNAIIKMRSSIKNDKGKKVNCYIPNVLSNIQHLINVPVLKAHQFVLQSNALKNHFGTVRFGNYNLYPVILHGQDIEKNIVDIYLNNHIRSKTRINIVDGLFGAAYFDRKGYGRGPTQWKTLSTGQTPNSLFFSFDPVAIESVIADYIINEQEKSKLIPYSHKYLHDAMEMGLGIHEHRESGNGYSRINYIERI